LSEQSATAARVTCYVDGFNLYHGLKEDTKSRAFIWLNLWSLAESQLLSGHVLERVIYFTSIPLWSKGKAERHRRYIAALGSVGVHTELGRFQREETICDATCKLLYYRYTEKLTDVHIATTMLADGVQGKYDWAYLISGDADQAPTLRALQRVAPTCGVYVLFPPRRHSAELVQTAHRSQQLYHRAFKNHQFADRLHVGGRTIEKPDNW
jgi:uncharacterized LabA/DUF88 family protein